VGLVGRASEVSRLVFLRHLKFGRQAAFRHKSQSAELLVTDIAQGLNSWTGFRLPWAYFRHERCEVTVKGVTPGL
jgi:hypothetical protein